MKTSAALAVVMLATTGMARAQEAPVSNDPVRPGWYVATMYSHLFASEKRYTGRGMGGIVAIGHHGDVASIEVAGLYYAAFKYGDEARYGDVPSLAGGQISLLFNPLRDFGLSRLYGLVAVGAFAEKNMPGKAADGSGLFGDLGLGYLQPLGLFGLDALLRGEVRYRADYQMAPRQDWEAPYFRDWTLNVGLQIPLSRKPPPPPPPEPPKVVPVEPAPENKQ